jgi:hypothetical protein
MKRIVILVAALLLAGCAYPTSQTEQGTGPGLLYFPDLPPGAHVMIDGSDAGLASAYDNRRPLSVSPGTHRVVVSNGGSPLIDKKYYVNAGTKVAVRND